MLVMTKIAFEAALLVRYLSNLTGMSNLSCITVIPACVT